MSSRAWLRQLLGLMWRSRPVIALFWAAMLTATSLGIILMFSGMSKLNAEQLGFQRFGSAAVVAEDDNWPRVSPGEPVPALSVPPLPQGVQSATLWNGSISLKLDGVAGRVDYMEGLWPSMATDQWLQLRAGQWPTSAGQCVIQGASLEPVLGVWRLSVVGTLQSTILPNTPRVLCAEGTWEKWKVTPETAALTNDQLSAKIYFKGSTAAVEQLASVGWDEAMQWDRRSLMSESSLGPVQLIRETLPWLLLPLLAGATGGLFVGRWIGVQARVLWTLGGQVRLFRRSALFWSSIGASVLAGTVSLLTTALLWTIRPAIRAIWPEAVGDPNLGITQSAGIACSTLVGSAIGCWVGMGRRPGTVSNSAPVSRPMPQRTRPLWAAAIVGSVLAASLILFSQGSLWPISLGAVALSTAAACCAVAGLRHLTQQASATGPSPRLLAARLMQERDKSLVVAVLAAVLSIVMASTALTTANGALLVKLATSFVPAGSTVIADRSQSGDPVPPQVLEQFRNDVGLERDPIRIRETLLHPVDGYLWNFSSLDDARDVLGPLSQTQVNVLSAGGVLDPTGTGGSYRIRATDEVLDLPTTGYVAPQGRAYRVAGYALQPALPDIAAPRAGQPNWLLFTGLTRSQDERADRWKADVGYTDIYLYAHHAPTAQLIQTAVTIILIGLGSALALLMAYALRTEARQLRSIVTSLRALGISRNWTQRVLAWLAIVLSGIPAVFATIVAAAVVLLASSAYPGSFDARGVPWTGVIAIGGVATLGAILGALINERRSRYERRMDT